MLNSPATSQTLGSQVKALYLDHDDQLALLEADSHSSSSCVLGRFVSSDDFQQLHLVNGGEVVHPNHLQGKERRPKLSIQRKQVRLNYATLWVQTEAGLIGFTWVVRGLLCLQGRRHWSRRELISFQFECSTLGAESTTIYLEVV